MLKFFTITHADGKIVKDLPQTRGARNGSKEICAYFLFATEQEAQSVVDFWVLNDDEADYKVVPVEVTGLADQEIKAGI